MQTPIKGSLAAVIAAMTLTSPYQLFCNFHAEGHPADVQLPSFLAEGGMRCTQC
jgi:hypothetical protein